MEFDHWYLLHVGIFLAAVAYLLRRYVAAEREAASFELLKVRDSFVHLVASGVLDKTDPVYKFYEDRITAFLDLAPDVGLDDMLEQLFKNASDLDSSMENSRRVTEEILAMESAQNPLVRQTISCYYVAVKRMMLSHSDALRIVFLIVSKLSVPRLVDWLPRTLAKGLRLAEFAQKEVYELRRQNACMH